MEQKPNLVPNYVDLAEFDKDLSARQAITPRLNRVISLMESLEDTNMLVSADVYHTGIAFYRYVKNASRENVPGTTSIFKDLQEQFPGRPGSVSDEPAAETPPGEEDEEQSGTSDASGNEQA